MMNEHAELDAELEALNAEVTAALAKRKAWMDEHMKDYAKVQVGEEIYDLGSGRLLGVVSKHYRYHADRDPRYDTSMSIEYEYQEAPSIFGGDRGYRFFGNTSSQIGLNIGTKKEAAERMRWRAEALEREPASWAEVFKSTNDAASRPISATSADVETDEMRDGARS